MTAKEGHRYYKERTRLETVIPLAAPFILYVDPSSACNLKCRFCPCGRAHDDLWTESKRSSVGVMEMDLFRKIVDDCSGFRIRLKFCGYIKKGNLWSIRILQKWFPMPGSQDILPVLTPQQTGLCYTRN